MHRAISPKTVWAPFARYSHAILVPPGATLLFASGQLGIAAEGSVPDAVEAQAALCFENIKAILAEAGMSFADVVRFNAFVTHRAYFSAYAAVRSRYVAGDAYASTLMVVGGFTRPEFKIEVEVTAAKSAS
jgi:enamine deaminase RidA (YjgF/YER057c/UK114 family)